MTEPVAPHTTTLPLVNGSTPLPPPPPSSPSVLQLRRRGRLQSRIGDVCTALITGALEMSAAGQARVAQVRQTMRRGRH